MIDVEGLPAPVAVAAMQWRREPYAIEEMRLEARVRLEAALAMCEAGEWRQVRVLCELAQGFLDGADRFEGG